MDSVEEVAHRYATLAAPTGVIDMGAALDLMLDYAASPPRATSVNEDYLAISADVSVLSDDVDCVLERLTFPDDYEAPEYVAILLRYEGLGASGEWFFTGTSRTPAMLTLEGPGERDLTNVIAGVDALGTAFRGSQVGARLLARRPSSTWLEHGPAVIRTPDQP